MTDTNTNSYVEMEGGRIGAEEDGAPKSTTSASDSPSPTKTTARTATTTTKTATTTTTRRGFSHQCRAFASMALPYFRDQPHARWLFAIMIVLTLLNSAVRVLFSYLARDFWSALSDNDPDTFYGIMQQFVVAMVVLAPINVLYRYQRQLLAIHWRQWMTERSLQLYFFHRVYYGLEQSSTNHRPMDTTTTMRYDTMDTDDNHHSSSSNNNDAVDNPDQRIAEDVRSFTEFSLTLFLTVLMAVVDLVCFSIILLSIMPALFLAILVFASLGTLATILIGKSLVQLNFDKLQKEANFRFSLVRVREHAESIAFLRGEPVEHDMIRTRLQHVIDNMYALNTAVRNLDFFTTYYTYLTWILPILVVAPEYFAGNVALGVVQQAAASFSHVLDDLSILVTQWESLTEFSAGIDRLATFLRVAQALAHPDPSSRSERSPLLPTPPSSPTSSSSDNTLPLEKQWVSLEESPNPQSSPSKIQLQQVHYTIQQPALTIHNLTLTTPHRGTNSHARTLIQNLSLSVPWGQNLLICGSSGQGKSSLLRAIAGLWTTGSGSITRPVDHDVYFLPQKPYCAMGTLRDQLLYPCTTHYLDPRRLLGSTIRDNNIMNDGSSKDPRHDPTQTVTDDQLLDILRTLDLGELPLRAGHGNAIRGLDTVMDWSSMLSLGEQQRLAFGRILVNRPRYVILDESTSALDIASERRMYGLLQELMDDSGHGTGRDPRSVSYVSVGHRPSLQEYHDTKLSLDGSNYSIDPIHPPKS